MKAIPETKLGLLTTLISSGITPLGGSSRYLSQGPVMFLRSQNILMNSLDLSNVAFVDHILDEEMKRTRVCNGDVLINITGASIGRVAPFDRNGDKANVNQHVCIIRPKVELLDFRYLAMYLSTPKFQGIIERLQRGGTRQALTFDMIADFDIPLPPLLEQRRIAAILDKADDIRRKREATFADLAQFERTLFFSMFSELIQKDKESIWVPVTSFVERFEGGLNLATPDTPSPETRYHILKVSAVTWRDYRPEESKPLPPGYEPPKAHFVRKGDLLFSRANTTELVGSTVYVDETPANLVLPDKIWRFVWRDPEKIEPLFVHALMNHPKVRFEIGRRATGTSGSMKNISMEKLLSMRVPYRQLNFSGASRGR